LKPSREKCRSSRIAACLLVLGSLLAVCTVGIQPVSSQVLYTSASTQTSTQTNTATYFTVAVATSNLVVTVLTVQYTTATSMFTVQNVQFTTLTSFITHIQVEQPAGEAAPAYNPKQTSENTLQYNSGLVSYAPRTEGNLEYNARLAGLQLATLVAIIFSLAFYIRRKS
jgi:undecaprenyl pyrophosphate phosphatase UppP